ncbi:hypothetical protein TRFO_38676 [Tritrichomonas foetus]|uniref:Uncharacterized protein n=1 Tax=Tritrichomonas foetus TaxID=1144522 RepID=A0A1J4JA48_9EUKA|nr:hypothetical protein TRFO_38676 [Tritrichomonas foetus]|eukprot:OHS95103.1 hypothetical protein TRFO_38676 [Tritrichomonas foetus]
MALEDLDLKNQEEIANLDEEWNSEKMQSRYNKPSPKLIELRQHARALLNARNFDEAQAIADQISKQEAYETKEAYVRMQREYRQAQEHLSNKYKNDRESLIDGFQSKMNGLLTAESNDLRPFEQRIENLHKVKKNMEITKKINAKNHINDKSQIKKSPLAVRTPPLVLNAKLKLPPLKAAPTRQATRASSKL